MRHPCREGNHVEGDADAAIGVGEAFGVVERGAGKHVAAKRPSGPLDQHVGRPHGAEVAHQRERIGIAHRDPVLVDHRQREAGPLEERARGADLDEGSDPRRGATGYLGLGQREGLGQFVEARRR